jgi:hypothetical protein
LGFAADDADVGGSDPLVCRGRSSELIGVIDAADADDLPLRWRS